MKIRINVRFNKQVEVVVDRLSNPSIWDKKAKTDVVNEGLFFSMTEAYAQLREVISKAYDYNRAAPVSVTLQFFADNGDGTIRRDGEQEVSIEDLSRYYTTMGGLSNFNAHKNWYRRQSFAKAELVGRLDAMEARMKVEAVKANELRPLLDEIESEKKKGGN